MSSSTRLQPHQSRVERRHRQRRRDAARPQLRLIRIEPRGAPDATVADVVADLAALVDAGLVRVVRGGTMQPRYEVVEPFGGGGGMELGPRGDH